MSNTIRGVALSLFAMTLFAAGAARAQPAAGAPAEPGAPAPPPPPFEVPPVAEPELPREPVRYEPVHGNVEDPVEPGDAVEHAEAPHAQIEGEHGGAHHEDPSKYFNFFDGIWPNPVAWKQQDATGGPLGDGKMGDQPAEREIPRPAPYALLVFNFLIVIWILLKYGSPAARKMAETRSDQIRDALEEAARLRDKAKAKLEEYNTKLKAAENEITQMVDGMRKDAETDRQRIIAAAEAQAKALQRDADQRIAAEIERARAALTREVAIVAAEAAATLLRERTTAADHAKLIDGFIQDVGAAPAPGASKEV